MIKESLKMRGHLKIKVNNKVVRDIPNVVVDDGKEWVAERMGASSQPNAMSHMAVGTGTNSAVVGNTSLQTQTGTRAALTSTTVSTANKKVTYEATFSSGSTTHNGALTEAGIFNGASGSTMLCRTTFDAVNKTENDSLTIEWDVSIS